MKIEIKKDINKMDEKDFLREAIREIQEKLKSKGEKITFDITKRKGKH